MKKAKWAGVLVLLLSGAIVISSTRFEVLYQVTNLSTGRETIFRFSAGTAEFSQFAPVGWAGVSNSTLRGRSLLDLRGFVDNSGLTRVSWAPSFDFVRRASEMHIVVPFWLPLLLLTVPTGLLWITDRRFKA